MEEGITVKKVKRYAFTTVLNIPYEDAGPKVTDALKEEGFGFFTEINVKETLKKKLGVDFRKYVILGACNPPYAHRTLKVDLNAGLLLPCNVIVYETNDRKAYVSAINPVSALEVIKNEELKKIAEEISEKRKGVVNKLAQGGSKRS